MLLPQHRRKFTQDPPQELETPEQIQRSIERDRALIFKTRREREEIATDRVRFELNREKMLVGIAMAALIALAVVLILNPQLIPVTLLGSGGLKILADLLSRPSGQSAGDG